MSTGHNTPAGPAVAPGRRRILVYVLLVVLAVGASWYGWRRYTAPAPPEVSLEGAEPEVAAGIEAARHEVLARPRSADAWGHLGLMLRATGHDKASDVCFARAEQLDPTNPRWPYLQGLTLLQGDPDAALPFLRRALERCASQDPENTAPRLRLAEVLLEQGHDDEAEEHFRRVLGQEPDNPRAHLDLGILAQSRGEVKEALAHLLRCTDSPFARQKASVQLAAVYQRLGDRAAAARLARQASHYPDLTWLDPYVAEYVALVTDRRGAQRAEANRLESEGRTQEALVVLRRLAETYPDGDAYVDLGSTLAAAGQYEEAEQALHTALRLTPNNVQANYYLSAALFYEGEQLAKQSSGRDKAREKFTAAAAAARRVTEINPAHGLGQMLLGLSLQHLGDRAAAIRALRTAVHCRPDVADPYLHLGEALAENGDVKEALSYLEQAAALAPPGDTRASEALGRWRNKPAAAAGPS